MHRCCRASEVSPFTLMYTLIFFFTLMFFFVSGLQASEVVTLHLCHFVIGLYARGYRRRLRERYNLLDTCGNEVIGFDGDCCVWCWCTACKFYCYIAPLHALGEVLRDKDYIWRWRKIFMRIILTAAK